MKLSLITAAIVLAASTSCKKNKAKNSKYETKVSPVVNTELSAGFSSYSRDVTMDVTFIVFNGCGQFDSFAESKENDTIVMKVLARYPKEAFCTDDLPRRTVKFNRSFVNPGTYYIKWVGPGQGGPESEVHRDTLVVQ